MQSIFVKTDFLIEMQREELKKMREKHPCGKQLEKLIINKEDIKEI